MGGYLVNDWMTTIEGTVTLWSKLLDWIPGLSWVGDCDYGELGYRVYLRYCESSPKPAYIIRNASYFADLGLPVPTIALLQDIMPAGSEARACQVEVCREAALTVFNSAYTREKYPELADAPYRIIPLPVDFSLFRPMPGAAHKRFDVCWIGAASSVKGWDLLCDIVRMSDLTFLLVMKDKAGGICNPRCEVVRRVPHADLPRLINECRMGLCTSREETQHLAGIEIGGCGLPLATTDVGAYWKRAPGAWRLCEGFDMRAMNAVALKAREPEAAAEAAGIAAYWQAEFGEEACRKAWEEAVEYVLQTEHPAGGAA